VTKAHSIFYSWQSDLPNRTNRGFIGDALERVARDASGEDTLVMIDRDTAGVAGSPAISDTILQKIEQADIFVPDVSIVTPAGASRPAPNPNVLLELGYAISVLGWDRIVTVMNTAYGAMTQLPFDLRGRRVLPYSLPDSPGEPKAEVRRELERRLKEAILPILNEHGARRRDEAKARTRSLIQFAKSFRDERLIKIKNGEGPASGLSSKHLVCAHAVPFGALSDDIRINWATVNQRETFVPPIGASGFNSRPNADGLIRENVNGGNRDGYLQLFRNGVVETVDSRMISGRGQRIDALPSTFFAINVSEFVTRMVSMWVALGIAPPACVLISLCGVKDVPFLHPQASGYTTKPFTQDEFLLPEIVIDDFESDPRPRMQHSLDALWQAAGEFSCPYFNSDGHWIGRLG
jgi:hypothetical protein